VLIVTFGRKNYKKKEISLSIWRWRIILKWILQKHGCEDVNSNDVAQNTNCASFVNTTTNLRVPKIPGICDVNTVTTSLAQGLMHHGGNRVKEYFTVSALW
jgi:hypothetical protein